MVELSSKTACDGLLPLDVGQTSLREAAPAVLTSLAPFAGQDGLLSKALKAAHGVGWPAPGQCLTDGDTRILWSGRGQAMLIGPEPDAGLADLAATTDQTDGWCMVEISGTDAVAVLARLVPVDLRPAALGEGRTVRSLLGHMTVSITPLTADSFLILAFRSMAGTLVQELHVAMQDVAARMRLRAREVG